MSFKGDYLIFAEFKNKVLCKTTLKCLPLFKYEEVVLA